MIITKNYRSKIYEEHFFDAVTGNEIKERTVVHIELLKSYITIHFSCFDNPFVKENTYTMDNSDLFKQEVFEIFIAPELTDPKDYLEIEINPNGAIFIANINNQDLIGTTLKAEKISKHNSGISSKVDKYNNYWEGEISIPLKLINKSENKFSEDYRINFYRIISKKSHKNPDWENSPEDSIYACWKCTYSPDKPKFHRSKYFGHLKLDI
jgi:hypothetical protein